MKNIFIIFLIFFSAFLFAQDQTPDKYKLAQSFEKEKNYEKAIDLYIELFKSQPDNYIFFSRLNVLYRDTKQYGLSISLLKDWLKTHPGDINISGELGNTYYLSGDHNSAFEIWDATIAGAPQSSVNYIIIANFAMNNRAFDKAIEILQKGKNRNPKSTQIIRQLANLYYFTMDLEKASDEYCELLELDEKQFPSVISGFRQLISRGNSIDICAAAIKKKHTATENIIYLRLLKDVYQYAKRYDEAVQIAFELNNLEPDPKTLFDFGQVLLRENQYSSAGKVFREVISQQTDKQLEALALLGLTDSKGGLLIASISNKHNWKEIFNHQKINSPTVDTIIQNYTGLSEFFDYNNRRPLILMKLAEIYSRTAFNNSKADSIYLAVLASYSQTAAGVDANYNLVLSDIRKNNFNSAQSRIDWLLKSNIADKRIKDSAKFYRAKICFWENDFDAAKELVNELRHDFTSEIANDALDLSVVLTLSKSDSTNLSAFAAADLDLFLGRFEQAIQKFTVISRDESALLLPQLARLKLAQLYIAEDKFDAALEILADIEAEEKISPFSDKALYLRGQIFQFGLNDKINAKKSYNDLLVKFPDSIYLEKCRENILIIN